MAAVRLRVDAAEVSVAVPRPTISGGEGRVGMRPRTAKDQSRGNCAIAGLRAPTAGSEGQQVVSFCRRCGSVEVGNAVICHVVIADASNSKVTASSTA